MRGDAGRSGGDEGRCGEMRGDQEAMRGDEEAMRGRCGGDEEERDEGDTSWLEWSR